MHVIGSVSWKSAHVWIEAVGDIPLSNQAIYEIC